MKIRDYKTKIFRDLILLPLTDQSGNCLLVKPEKIHKSIRNDFVLQLFKSIRE